LFLREASRPKPYDSLLFGLSGFYNRLNKNGPPQAGPF
jgi:hypothetical protein